MERMEAEREAERVERERERAQREAERAEWEVLRAQRAAEAQRMQDMFSFMSSLGPLSRVWWCPSRCSLQLCLLLLRL